MSGHEFIEVLNRRWCVCCTLFQTRRNADSRWLPVSANCRRDTPYARRDTEILQPPPNTTAETGET